MLDLLDRNPHFAAFREDVRRRFASGTLRVIEGAQQGASQPLGAETLSVGAGLDNDIVLIADDLGERHARIGLSGLFGGSLRVEAVEHPVMLAGDTVLEPGYVVDLPLPARIGLGTARLEVAGRKAPLTIDGKTAIVLGLAALLTVGVAFNPFVGRTTFTPGPAAQAAPSLGLPSPAPLAETRDAEPQIRADIEAGFVRIVAANGLAEKIAVHRIGPNEIALNGQIDRTEAPAWRNILMQIDAEGRDVAVTRRVQVIDRPVKPPRIRSVWFGTVPKVMLADGRLHAVGETTADGWAVNRIEAGVVTFGRSGQGPVKITF